MKLEIILVLLQILFPTIIVFAAILHSGSWNDGHFPSMNRSVFSRFLIQFVDLFRKRISFSRHYVFPSIAAILFLIAIVVRIKDFGLIPGGVNQDGAMAALDAKALLEYGTDRLGMKYPVLFTAWGYGQMSVLLSYLMVPFFKVFGFSVVAMRLPGLLVSLVGLLALFLLIKNLWGKSPALFVLGFAAINPWHIMQSRWALDCNIFPHMLILGIYFLHKSLTKPAWIHVAMFFFAMCMYSYGVAFLTLPFFLTASFIIILWSKLVPLRHLLSAVVTYFFFAWPVWTTMVINALKGKTISTPFFTMAYFPESVRSNEILFFAQNKLELLRMNLYSLMRVIVYQGPDYLWNALPSFGSLYLFSLSFVILGALVTGKGILLDENKTARYGQILVFLALLTGLWAGLVVSNVNINRINLIFYPLIILGGVGIWQLFRWSQILAGFTMVVYAIFFGLFCSQYFDSFQREISFAFNQGLGEAVKSAHKIPFEKLIVTQTGLGNTSEIYTQFFAEMDARYIQGKGPQKASNIQIPYKKRYQYQNISPQILNPNGKTLYIANQLEYPGLALDSFEVLPYSQFSLLIPKHLYRGSALEEKEQDPNAQLILPPQKLIGSQDFATIGINGPVARSGLGFIVQGQNFKRGFGTHGSSKYSYTLPRPFKLLKLKVGISDDTNCGDGVEFRVYGNGLPIWNSPRILTGNLVSATIPIAGIENLSFETIAGQDNRCDHANWLEPILIP